MARAEESFEDWFDRVTAEIVAEHEECIVCINDPLRNHNGPVLRG